MENQENMPNQIFSMTETIDFNQFNPSIEFIDTIITSDYRENESIHVVSLLWEKPNECEIQLAAITTKPCRRKHVYPFESLSNLSRWSY